MAGVELANAWVNIIPNTSKIAPQIKSAFGEVEPAVQKKGSSIGTGLSNAMGKALKVGAASVGVAAGAALGGAITKGFGRLTAIEGAQAKLRGLGSDANEVSGIMDNALAAVKGTANGLGEAATVSAQMVAAGIKPGQQLEQTLKTVGDTAAIAGRSMEDVGLIFGSVAARGKLQGDDMLQLMSAGVPVLQLLAEETGKTSEEVSDMVSNGEIDFATFERAMRNGVGGAALEMGNTFQGALANMGAAMGRFGATVLQPFYDSAPALMTSVGGIFDAMGDAVAPAMEQIGTLLAPAFESLGKIIDTSVAPAMADFARWLGDVAVKVTEVAVDPENWRTLGDLFGSLRDAAAELGPSLGNLVGSFAQITASISVATWQALAAVLNALAPLITSVLVPLVEQVANIAAQNPGAVQAIVTAFLGFKAVSSIAGPVGTAVTTIKNLGGAAKFAHTAFKGASLGEGMLNIMAGAKSANPVVAKMGTSMAGAGTKMAKGSMAASGVGKAFSMIGRAAMTVIRFINPWVAGFTLVTGALTLFFTKTETGQKIWHGFTQALGAGWDWVVEKFKAGLDWIQSTFGPTFESLSGKVSGVFSGIKDKVSGVFDWFKDAFTGVRDFLFKGDYTASFGKAFGLDEDSAIVDKLFRIRDIFVGVRDLIFKGDYTGKFGQAIGLDEDSPVIGTILNIRNAIVGFKDVAVAAWDFMKAKWEEFTTGFGQFYQTWIAPVIDFIGTAFGALKDVAVAAWGLMKAKWEEFTIGFGQFYQTWIAPGVNLLVTIFGVLRDAAVAGWQLMQQKWQEFTQLFVEFYQAWIVPIIDAMKIGFQILGSVVSAAFNGIWTAIQFVGSVISAVWSGIIQPILSLFMSVAQAVGTFVASVFTAVIGGAFRVMGSVISSIWNGVIKPTWDFFRNAAGLLADVLTGNFSNIRNRFSSMGQAISNIVHGVINAAMNFFKSIFENAKQVAASFGQAIGRMVGTVRNKIGEMMGVLGQIPSKVQGVFSSAGSWLVNAGKNIISGLINGIKSMFGQVENAIGSVMPDKIRGMIGFSGGGIYMAQGGITRAYIDGGIDKLERYANGGSKEKHTAQIAKGGEWRIWAEPETGGESYIPLAKSKRKRSTQILAKTADIFGLSVVDKKGEPVKPGTSSQVAPAKPQYFANGGITVKSLRDFVEGRPANGHQASRSLEGAPYVWGGSNWGDCSGAMSAVAAFAAGISPFPRKFATGSEAAWLSAHGFKSGRGKKGDLRIGFKNGGPAGGHTAGTLPDGTNIEMGGGRGNGQIGGRAAGAWDSYFDTFFYKTIKPPKPPKMNKILDQNAIPDGSTMTIDGVPVTVSADDTTTGATGENTVTVALSPEDAAKATAAKGLGDQSILDFAVDGIFDMLGMKDSTIKKLLTTKGKDLFPSGDSIVTAKEVKEQPRTNVAAKNAQAIESDAVASMPETQMAKDPQLAAPKPKKKEGPKWGEPFFAREIARSAKAHNLDVNGAKIGLATALVESGSPLRMWANRAVPESLKYRHDAVGSDYDSVGLFQQRDNGAWGTVKQRMTPYDSAGMFFDVMLRKFPNWKGMDPGAVAQGVQVSAFPDRYAGQMGRGLQLAKRSGVFDRGGLGYGKGLLPKDVVEPERVLSPQQTRAFDDLVYKEMPKQRDGGEGTTVVINLDGQEVLRKRVDKVEGELNINTEELGRLRRRTSVAVAGTTRGGAM